MNFTNITWEYDKLQSIKWDDLIRQGCDDWKNYSTYAHEFYIILFWLWVSLGIIRRFFNPKFKYFFGVITLFNKKIEIKDEFYWIDWLQELIVMILFIRIFQVYYIMRLYL